MKNPKISVICLAYNHEKYIKETIDSILKQSFSDFEVVIADDCSKDNTVKIIESYCDSRIKLLTKEFNRGINDSMNLALSNALGEYIVIMGTDDIMKDDYLDVVNNAFLKNKNIDIIYTNLSIIDENGNLVKAKNGTNLTKIINKFKNKYEILRKMFLECNQLFSPGMAIRKELLQEIAPFDASIINTQDYQMHIELLLKSDYLILDKPGIMYRQSLEHNSISSVSKNSISRENAEIPKILETYLKINDLETLRKIFPENKNNFKNSKLIPFYLGKEALNSSNSHRQMWGYRTIANFIADRKNFDILYKEEHFDFAQYLSLIKDFTFENSSDVNKIERKLKKYRKLTNIFLITIIIEFVLILLLTVLIFINI